MFPLTCCHILAIYAAAVDLLTQVASGCMGPVFTKQNGRL